MSSTIDELKKYLNKIPLKSLTKLSKNDSGNFSVIQSEDLWYSLDDFKKNHHSMDALKIKKNTFVFVEFKDTTVPVMDKNFKASPSESKNIGLLVFKTFGSIDQLVEISELTPLESGKIFEHPRVFVYVYSTQKNPTSLTEMKTLETFLKERFGNLLHNIEVMDSTLFSDLYLNEEAV